MASPDDLRAALLEIRNMRAYMAMGWEPNQADDGSWWWRHADGGDFTYERMTDPERVAHLAVAAHQAEPEPPKCPTCGFDGRQANVYWKGELFACCHDPWHSGAAHQGTAVSTDGPDFNAAPSFEQAVRLAAWLTESGTGDDCVWCPLGKLLDNPADVANDPSEAHYQCEVLGRVWGEYAPCTDLRCGWFIDVLAVAELPTTSGPGLVASGE